jgi:protein subunit release factor A
VSDDRDGMRDGGDEVLAETDLRVEVVAHALGPEGRPIRTSAAVRITHVPTGLVETCDVHPTQVANYQKALHALTARVRAAGARRR